MKFDSIIIGGGLTGLVAGISLQSKGKKCLIVSAGQSALHFFSGSFELCSAPGDYEDACLLQSKLAERIREIISGLPRWVY